MAGRAGRRDFGALRKLPSGRWQASYLDPSGRRRNAPETFARKQDAARWLAEVESTVARGDWRDPNLGDVTLAAYADTWIGQRPGLRPRTIELYRWLLGRYITPHLGGVRLADPRQQPGGGSDLAATAARRGRLGHDGCQGVSAAPRGLEHRRGRRPDPPQPVPAARRRPGGRSRATDAVARPGCRAGRACSASLRCSRHARDVRKSALGRAGRAPADGPRPGGGACPGPAISRGAGERPPERRSAEAGIPRGSHDGSGEEMTPGWPEW